MRAEDAFREQRDRNRLLSGASNFEVSTLIFKSQINELPRLKKVKLITEVELCSMPKIENWKTPRKLDMPLLILPTARIKSYIDILKSCKEIKIE